MRYWKRLKEKKFIRFLCVMYKKIRYDRIVVYAAQAGFYLIMSAAPIIMLLLKAGSATLSAGDAAAAFTNPSRIPEW